MTLVALLAVLGVTVGGGIALATGNGSAVPTPTITSSPPNPTNSTSATFQFSAKKVDGFTCSLDNAAYTACSSPKTYTGLSAASHTFKVKAVSGAQSSSEATYTWLVDTAPPPAPTIGTKPSNPSDSSSPTFAFSDGESGVSFLCSLDGASPAACSSPKSYSGLALGSHSFSVRAKDAAGNQSGPTVYTWSIVPPSPTITAKPANPTSQTSASFSFTDARSGVTFQCALDSAAFAPCSSPKSYSGLAEGTHTFQVKAVSGSQQSAATSYSWRIDTSAPSITVTFPANGGTYDAAGWNAGCAGGPGICGSATDPSGVSAGFVSIRQVSTGKYWNGSSFSSTSETFNAITQTSGSGTTFSGRYPLAVPAAGSYTVHVRATDGLGNTTTPASQVVVNFTITTASSGQPFTVNGNATGALAPGVTSPINLVFTNPNNVAITVTSVTTSITGVTPAPTKTCGTAGNFSIGQQLQGTVVVPANSTKSLSDLSVPQSSWPTIRMLNPPVNQDGCKNASISLSYTGSAHS